MSPLHPKIRLSEIRRIGWQFWDPIGLADGSEFGPSNCADEYDGYLLNVVSILCRGGARDEAADYLTASARDHMGVPSADVTASRSTVDALAEYLAQLPEKPSISD